MNAQATTAPACADRALRPSAPTARGAPAAAVLVTALLSAPGVQGAEDVPLGRYTTVPATPTAGQAELLATPVRVQFPASVTTVGEALEALLAPSGYRLAPAQSAPPSRMALLALPLPEPHRTLGPMPLATALETLAGPAFRLVEDPVHRLVSFELCRPPPAPGP